MLAIVCQTNISKQMATLVKNNFCLYAVSSPKLNTLIIIFLSFIIDFNFLNYAQPFSKIFPTEIFL